MPFSSSPFSIEHTRPWIRILITQGTFYGKNSEIFILITISPLLPPVPIYPLFRSTHPPTFWGVWKLQLTPLFILFPMIPHMTYFYWKNIISKFRGVGGYPWHSKIDQNPWGTFPHHNTSHLWRFRPNLHVSGLSLTFIIGSGHALKMGQKSKFWVTPKTPVKIMWAYWNSVCSFKITLFIISCNKNTT